MRVYLEDDKRDGGCNPRKGKLELRSKRKVEAGERRKRKIKNTKESKKKGLWG